MDLNNTFYEMQNRCISFLFLVLLCFVSFSIFSVADNRYQEGLPTSRNAQAVKTQEKVFSGLPDINLKLSNLDPSGELIYIGIDLAVFKDSTRDGIYTIKAGKVKRFINTHTQFTVDLGSMSEYEKGVKHKLAMRTLYVPTGTDQNLIVIAAQNNGTDGWVEIPGSTFVPSYFINGEENPYIKHTEKWDKNRLTYNRVKSDVGLSMLERPFDIFWSGEKFMLNIETSEEVPTLKASIDGTAYETVVYPAKITSEGALYTGELWEENMFFKWGNYVPKEFTFKLEVIDNGEILETKEIPIIVDNREQFYRIRREY